jgi:hypothetical protein
MRRVLSEFTIPVRYRKTISCARETFKEVGKYMYISDPQNFVRPAQNFRVSISANTKKVQPAFHNYLCILNLRKIFLDLFPSNLLHFIPNFPCHSFRLTQTLLGFRLQTRLPAAKVPVVQVPVSLHELRAEVDGVAPEEQVVGGRDGHGVAHEGAGVEG